VFVAQTLTHFLEEHFDRPMEFDVDRPQPGPDTYQPFGVGNHACLGAGLGQVQVMVNAAILLNEASFQITPSNYRLRTRLTPPAPVGLRVLYTPRR
jgi:cytochrome P450